MIWSILLVAIAACDLQSMPSIPRVSAHVATVDVEQVQRVFPSLRELRAHAFLESDSDGCVFYADDRGEFVSDQRLPGCGWIAGRAPGRPRPFDEEADEEADTLRSLFQEMGLSIRMLNLTLDDAGEVTGPSTFEFDKCWTYTFAPGTPLPTPEADEVSKRINQDWFETFQC